MTIISSASNFEASTISPFTVPTTKLLSNQPTQRPRDALYGGEVEYRTTPITTTSLFFFFPFSVVILAVSTPNTATDPQIEPLLAVET